MRRVSSFYGAARGPLGSSPRTPGGPRTTGWKPLPYSLDRIAGRERHLRIVARKLWNIVILLVCCRLIHIFVSPKHGSSSIKYNRHNIQQNKQTDTRKKYLAALSLKVYVHLLSNFVTRFRHKSLGISNEKHSWQYLMWLILLLLNNFIKID